MRNRFWNIIRETEWFAVIAIVLLATAFLIAVLIAVEVVTPLLWVLVVTMGFAAVVSSVFSHRR